MQQMWKTWQQIYPQLLWIDVENQLYQVIHKNFFCFFFSKVIPCIFPIFDIKYECIMCYLSPFFKIALKGVTAPYTTILCYEPQS